MGDVFFKGFKTAGLTAVEGGRAVGRPARGASPARRAPRARSSAVPPNLDVLQLSGVDRSLRPESCSHSCRPLTAFPKILRGRQNDGRSGRPRFGIRVEVQGVWGPAGRGGTTMGRCLGLGGCLTKFQTAGNAEKHCRAKRRPPLRRKGGATQPSREQARTATAARSSVLPTSNILPHSLKSCSIAFPNAQPGALWALLAERQAEIFGQAAGAAQECEQDSGD